MHPTAQPSAWGPARDCTAAPRQHESAKRTPPGPPAFRGGPGIVSRHNQVRFCCLRSVCTLQPGLPPLPTTSGQWRHQRDSCTRCASHLHHPPPLHAAPAAALTPACRQRDALSAAPCRLHSSSSSTSRGPDTAAAANLCREQRACATRSRRAGRRVMPRSKRSRAVPAWMRRARCRRVSACRRGRAPPFHPVIGSACKTQQQR